MSLSVILHCTLTLPIYCFTPLLPYTPCLHFTHHAPYTASHHSHPTPHTYISNIKSHILLHTPLTLHPMPTFHTSHPIYCFTPLSHPSHLTPEPTFHTSRPIYCFTPLSPYTTCLHFSHHTPYTASHYSHLTPHAYISHITPHINR